MTSHCLKICANGIASLCVSMVLTISPATASDYLSKDELQTILVGKTFNYSGETTGITKVSMDGTFAIIGDSRYGDLTGRWWFSDSNWCRSYDLGGFEVCSQYEAFGDGKIKSTSGYILENEVSTESAEMVEPQS